MWYLLFESFFIGATSYFPPAAAQKSGFCSVCSFKIFCKEFIHSHGFTLLPQKSSNLKAQLRSHYWASDSYVQWTISHLCLDIATSSYSISKITLPSPVRDLFPSSWILYILSTGTFSFLIRQLRKLASCWIPSSPPILPESKWLSLRRFSWVMRLQPVLSFHSRC